MNKKKYNNILKSNRLGRKRVKKLKELKKRLTFTQKKLESEGGKLGFDPAKDGPFDADFWFKMETGLESPRMQLPDPKDKLFVTKAIDKYEPLITKAPDSMEVDDRQLFKPLHRTP